MKVTIEEIKYIAKLAKLKFTEEEVVKFTHEFGGILSHFENINKEDLSGIDLNHFEDAKSVLRKDDMKVFDDKGELFQNVKNMRESYIMIPKVIE